MSLKYTRVKKHDIPKYFGGDRGAIHTFFEIAGYSGYKRLMTLVQKMENRGYNHVEAVDYINRHGANFVERALKASENLDFRVKAVEELGLKRAERVIALAKKHGRSPEQTLQRYRRLARKLSENPKTSERLSQIEAIKTWFEIQGIPELEMRRSLVLSMQLINSGSEPIIVTEIKGQKLMEPHKIEFGTTDLMQFVDLAPVSVWITKAKSNRKGLGSIAFMTVRCSKENGQKVLSIHDVQTHLPEGTTVEPLVKKEWPRLIGYEIEKRARSLGFKRLRLLRPEKHTSVTKVKNPEGFKRFYYKVGRMLSLKNKTDLYMEKNLA